MMTDQLNIENQGAGAEVAKLALHYLGPMLDATPDVMLVNFVHDSFFLDAPDDPEVYKPAAIKLAEAMQEAWFEMSKLFAIKDLPMPVQVKVGYNWGDIESDDVEDLWTFNLDPYAMLEKIKNV
jgi:DNA polymerase I-like protein with 3'-5' exonuclease and polymerase domains